MLIKIGKEINEPYILNPNLKIIKPYNDENNLNNNIIK